MYAIDIAIQKEKWNIVKKLINQSDIKIGDIWKKKWEQREREMPETETERQTLDDVKNQLFKDEKIKDEKTVKCAQIYLKIYCVCVVCREGGLLRV